MILLIFLILPSIKDTLIPEKWNAIGPFLIGAREGVAELPPADSLFKYKKWRNFFCDSGIVKETTVMAKDGFVKINFKNIKWDTIMNIYGITGLLCITIFRTEVNCPEKCRALAVTKRLGSFRINDRRYLAEPYSFNFFLTPCVLDSGKNIIRLTAGGFGNPQFYFKLIPVKHKVIILKDFTLPDLIKGKKVYPLLGIPVLNTTQERLSAKLIIKKDTFLIRNLFPLCVKKIPITLSDSLTVKDSILKCKIICKGDAYNFEIKFRVRKPYESFCETFLSKIDSSVQYYAVLPPKNYNPDKKYALILSLHGAGVEARGLVNAYSQKDWAFIVAPTNRRRFGFDWEDWGRLDALEILNIVKKKYPVDTLRIYLTGHSMGGHGTWAIGTFYFDNFAAIAPEAGWCSFHLYIPWTFHQRNIFWKFTSPVKDILIREDNPVAYLENLKNTPVFIVHGREDDNVPVYHSRIFSKRLHYLKYNYEYIEVPGKKHWWKGCVDLPELMKFLKEKKLNPYPEEIVFKTPYLGLKSKAYYFEIIEQKLPYHDSEIKSSLKGDTLKINCENVKILKIHLTKDLVKGKSAIFKIEGQTLKFRFIKDCDVYLKEINGRFYFVSKPKVRDRLTYGGIKVAYFSPFIIVYGTNTEKGIIEKYKEMARLQAMRWYRRANGYCEILPDTEITEDLMRRYNLILIGNANTNKIIQKINPFLPIKFEDGKITVGEEKFEGDLCLTLLYRNPFYRDKLILLYSELTEKSLPYSQFFLPLYSGAGVPDFLIFDEKVQNYGFAGVILCGFFDQNWNLNNSLLWHK